MSSKPWPAWLALSSSPVESLQARFSEEGIYFAAVVGFVVTVGLTTASGFLVPSWRWGFVLAVVGFAAVPVVGVALNRGLQGPEVVAERWLRAIRGSLLPFVVAASWCFTDRLGAGGAVPFWGALPVGLLGVVALVIAAPLTKLTTDAMSARPPRRGLFVAVMIAVGLVLVVSAVKTARGDVRAAMGDGVWEEGQVPAVRAASREACRRESSHTSFLHRDCGRITERTRFVFRRHRRVASTLVSDFLRRDAYVEVREGRLVSLEGVAAEGFLGDVPRAELVVAAAVVWAAALVLGVVMRRRVRGWRSLLLVEGVVDTDGVIVRGGQRFRVDRALSAGATVLIDAPPAQVASYREHTHPLDRVVVATAAQWARALDAAERQVWFALGLSVAIVGGLLAFDLLLVL